MAEYYRQFAFVSSVLTGFAFTFYGTLLVASREHRTGRWAAFMAVAASVALLPVTLGMTFSAARASLLPPSTTSPSSAESERIVTCSTLFLAGVVLLFASFGLSGWMLSRRLGIATAILAALGVVGTFLIISPFLHVNWTGP